MTEIKDLVAIEFEHGLNERGVPFITVRALGSGVVLVGQVDPDTARDIAQNASTVIGRSEYEQDLFAGLTDQGVELDLIGRIMTDARDAETRRMTE